MRESKDSNPSAPISPSVHGGGTVKINVKRTLLNPAGREIFGILRLNGTSLYIPESGLTIGRGKDCDVRIDDSLIDRYHTLILPVNEKLEITNLSTDRGLAVKPEGSKELVKLAMGEEHALETSGNARLFLELSGIGEAGQKRLLEMRLEIPQRDLAQAVEKLLEQKPSITTVNPEQALVRVAEPSTAIEPVTIDSNLTAGTIFSRAKTLDKVFDIYFSKQNKYGRWFARGLTSIFLSATTLVPIFLPSTAVGLATFFGAWTGPLFACTAAVYMIVGATITTLAMAGSSNADSNLRSLLNHVDPAAVAKTLSGKSKENRDLILAKMRKNNREMLKLVLVELNKQLCGAKQSLRIEKESRVRVQIDSKPDQAAEAAAETEQAELEAAETAPPKKMV